MSKRRRGEVVVLRELSRGRIWRAAPWLVVEDDGVEVALFLPAGTPTRMSPVSRLAPEPAGLEPRVAEVDTLRLAAEARAHALLLWWRAGAFVGWYVNFERFARSSVGFDYVDHELDIFVGPNRAWEYDDEDEFEEAVRIGLLSPEDAAGVRAEARRMIERIERWDSPFRDGWEAWQPDPEWRRPFAFPPGWDVLD